MKFILTILLTAFATTQALPALQSFLEQQQRVVLNAGDEKNTEKEKEEKKLGKEKCLNSGAHLQSISTNAVTFAVTNHPEMLAPQLEYQSPPPDQF